MQNCNYTARQGTLMQTLTNNTLKLSDTDCVYINIRISFWFGLIGFHDKYVQNPMVKRDGALENTLKLMRYMNLKSIY